MKSFPLFLLLSLGLTSCKHDSDSPTGLPGTWQLTSRQCYCLQTPLPNETVMFTKSEFRFASAGQPTKSGTYAPATIIPCGTTRAIQVMRFRYADGTQRDYMVTVSEQTLVLDDGTQRGCLADADVVSTYARRP